MKPNSSGALPPDNFRNCSILSAVLQVPGHVCLSIDDPFGRTYHQVSNVEQEICFGKVHSDQFKQTLGDECMPFWDYGILFPDIINDCGDFQYAIVKTGWQYLNTNQEWSEFE